MLKRESALTLHKRTPEGLWHGGGTDYPEELTAWSMPSRLLTADNQRRKHGLCVHSNGCGPNKQSFMQVLVAFLVREYIRFGPLLLRRVSSW